jgi:hypothetical protein
MKYTSWLMKMSVPSYWLERVDERVDRRDVEVGRRLVHQQQVGRVDEEAGEGEAGFLAAGEHGDLLVNVVLAEEEPPRMARPAAR